MYNIYFLENKWRMATHEGGYIDGTLKQVVSFAEIFWGFNKKEIDNALDDMVKKKHDSAHFGIYKHFIYSFDRMNEDLEQSKNYGFH